MNHIKEKPESIVITGGEPFLHKDLGYILEGLHTFRQIKVVTNLTLDVSNVLMRVKKIKTHKILFECTFHENAIDFDTFISRALILKRDGFLGSVRIVDVNPKKTIKYIAKFAAHDLEMTPLNLIGIQDGHLRVSKNEEASNLIRKPPVLCKIPLVLFAPDGNVYNCHTKLYWGNQQSSFGNLVTGFEIPDAYYVCHDYGFCNPCQIGYMDVRDLGEDKGIKKGSKVLLSNPPKGVIPSRNAV